MERYTDSFKEALAQAPYVISVGDNHFTFKVQRLLTFSDATEEIRFLPDWRKAEPYWSEISMSFDGIDISRMPVALERWFHGTI